MEEKFNYPCFRRGFLIVWMKISTSYPSQYFFQKPTVTIYPSKDQLENITYIIFNKYSMEGKVNVKVNADNLNHRIFGADDSRLSHDKIKNAEDFVELKTRYRSLEIYVKNNTSSVMQFSGYYFDTGDWYYTHKTNTVKPGQTWFEACANKDGKASGVTGGCSFEIKGIRIGFGFCNPVMGCYKCSIVKGGAKEAYDVCETENDKQLCVGPYRVMAHMGDAKVGGHRAVIFTVTE